MNNKPFMAVHNTADESQVETAKREAFTARDKELLFLQSILSREEGRSFIWGLLDKCGTFRANFGQDHEIYRMEGKREIGLELLGDAIKSDIDLFHRMMKENANG